MKTIDLRLSEQSYQGFYIFKNKESYSVGKNGTSNHTNIPKNKDTKINILSYIYKAGCEL